MLELLRRSHRYFIGGVIFIVAGVFVAYLGIGGPGQSNGPTTGTIVQLGSRHYSVADLQRVRTRPLDVVGFDTATPHGFAYFTTTHAGSSNAFTHSSAASVSVTLLKDSSLPCTCWAVATQSSAGAGST